MAVEKYLTSNLISKYSSLAMAKYALQHRAQYANVTPILMGDDGKFWICNTPKRAYQLIALGYEEA